MSPRYGGTISSTSPGVSSKWIVGDGQASAYAKT